MYELPGLKNVQKVVIDETVIEGHSKPYIVYKAEAAEGAEVPPRKVSGASS
jgi:ATP-dependent Clp protease ATP-binding subunit ClpX